MPWSKHFETGVFTYLTIVKLVICSIPTNEFLLGQEKEDKLASKYRWSLKLWQNIFTYGHDPDNKDRREIEELENGIYGVYSYFWCQRRGDLKWKTRFPQRVPNGVLIQKDRGTWENWIENKRLRTTQKLSTKEGPKPRLQRKFPVAEKNLGVFSLSSTQKCGDQLTTTNGPLSLWNLGWGLNRVILGQLQVLSRTSSLNT